MNIKAPFLTPKQIEEVTVDLRNKYESVRKVPVDVLGFAEFDLGLEFEFAHIKQLGQEAFLRPDLSGIWFDTVAFQEQSYQSRLRFSAAHELGHFFLHKDIYGRLKFTTVKEWSRFIESIPKREYSWIESHADEFAGRLLIPTEHLAAALDESIDDAEKEGYFEQGESAVLEYCSRAICRDFLVSRVAMHIRIEKSDFWPSSKIPRSGS